MLTSERLKLLTVRLPEAEKRRIKSLAASQGMSLQEVVHQALEAWASQFPVGGRTASRPGAAKRTPKRTDP